MAETTNPTRPTAFAGRNFSAAKSPPIAPPRLSPAVAPLIEPVEVLPLTVVATFPPACLNVPHVKPAHPAETRVSSAKIRRRCAASVRTDHPVSLLAASSKPRCQPQGTQSRKTPCWTARHRGHSARTPNRQWANAHGRLGGYMAQGSSQVGYWLPIVSAFQA